MKYALILTAILLIGGCSSNPAGIDDDYYDRAEEMFNMVETAYEEERPFTEFEENEVERYGDWAHEKLPEGSVGDYTEQELNRYGALAQVSWLSSQYSLISISLNFEEEVSDEKWEEFNELYNKSEKALQKGTDLEDIVED